MTRFPIRFSGVNRFLLPAVGMLPRWCHVDVDAPVVRVRMAWGFSARIPRSSVRGAVPYTGRVMGWGAHGWRGTWLVNGSSKGIVELTIDPRARAWVLGWPVRLKTLLVAVEDPDGLIAAVG